MKPKLILISLALALASSAAFAGPFADFETGLRQTYASYRMALFATNSGNKDKTETAIGDFDKSWGEIVARYGPTPPPQYQDDPEWSATLAKVSEAIAKAKGLADDGQLDHSHEVLEHIRDAIGSLHERNGIETFSDRMNAYHAKMEQVIGLSVTGDGTGQRLLEQAAVLAYLADDMLAAPPAEANGNVEFTGLSAAVEKSVAELQAAVRAGDAAAMKAAISGLKKPYSKLFLKFG